MYKLVASKRFQKQLKAFLRKHPDIEEIITNKLTQLQEDPNHPSLKTHKLSGRLKDYWAPLSLTSIV
jgi:mRNA-degrading endonuclease YafQ of YafQ-DinJ toxin-antitoxin module